MCTFIYQSLYVFFTGIIFSVAWATPQDSSIDLQLRWHHQFQFAGYYAAVEKGFYQEEGLEVRLHPGDPTHRPVPEVLAERAQYGVGNSEVLYQRLQSKPLVALAAIFQHSPSILLTLHDSGIYSVHDLIGKKVMLMNMTEDADFLSMIRNEGVSLSQVDVIPSSYQLDDLISGKIDAFNSYLTNEPYILQQHKILYNVITPSNYRIDFYSDILFTSEAELRDHPKRVEALRRATLRGWCYAMDNPEEIINLLLNKYHIDKTREHLEFEANEMRKLIFPDLIEIGHMNPARWQHMADTFVKAGLIKPNYLLDGFIYDTTPKRLPEWVIPVLMAVFIVLTIITFFAYYLLRLNSRLTKAKDKLRESEEQLRLVLEGAELGFWDWNIVTGTVERNERWANMLGYSYEEIKHTPQQWTDFIYPDDRETAWQSINNTLEGRSIAHKVEYRMLHKDGSLKWILDQANVMQRDTEGKPIRMSGTHSDITDRRQAEDLLRESNERLTLATFHTGVGIWDWNLQSQEMIWDDSMHALYHIRRADFAGTVDAWGASLYPDDFERGNQEIQQALLGEKPFDTEFRVCWSTGEIRYIKAVAKVFRDAQENPIRMLGTNVDITDLKQAEFRLQLAASVFTHAREGIMITDASGIIIEVNNSFTQLSGYNRQEVLGQNPRILKSGRHTKEFYHEMWASLLEKDYWNGEIWNQSKKGEIYAEMLTISAVHDRSGKTQNYVALFTNITSLKEHQKQLEHIAHFDALTNLPNRVLLADRLKQAMILSERHQQSLVVAYLDLDGFKLINDTFGHEIGDNLLVTVSQRMKNALRDGDTLARIGGDEFVAVLVDIEQIADSKPLLSRLVLAAAEPVTISDTMMHVSASIGATFYPQDSSDADQLIRHADQAMYIAKQSGKNCYHLFDINLDTAVKTQFEKLYQIRHAFDQREFILYYQPKVNMKTGQVIGAEALIRWQHPERGILTPANFLPIIENHPISVELGEWVIDTALMQIIKWRKLGLNIPISVNVDACQLQHPYFVSNLSLLLAKYPEIEPYYLELEILETSALCDILEISDIMQACRKIGVKFALDDFGTGYSSLTYLKSLPVDILKIDQCFIRDMLEDSDDLAIVNAVIGLANIFHRQVIAEGVETIEHGIKLLSLGCVLAQGNGIAHPMHADEIPVWVDKWCANNTWII